MSDEVQGNMYFIQNIRTKNFNDWYLVLFIINHVLWRWLTLKEDIFIYQLIKSDQNFMHGGGLYIPN